MTANFLLGILTGQQCCSPEELPGETAMPAYYDTPHAAKAAGRAVLTRHPDAIGFTVAKIFNVGHYRTVATEWRTADYTI